MLPEYLPFDGNASRLKMGLRPLEPDEWVEVDDAIEVDLEEKSRLLAERHDEVVAYRDDDATLVASAELLGRLVDHLTTQLAMTPAVTEGCHPIEAAGRLTQEDWCVMSPDADGSWRMVAASVCFPTRWVMPDKLGQDLHALHGPVAHYDAELGRPVDSFFDRLGPGEGKWRLNWNVVDDPERFQPRARNQFAESGPHPLDDVPELTWLRVERQTLVRLPTTGAIVFGIHVHQDPLSSIADSPDVLARLASSLRTMRAETWAYKSLDGYGNAVLAWIDDRIAQLTA